MERKLRIRVRHSVADRGESVLAPTALVDAGMKNSCDFSCKEDLSKIFPSNQAFF